MAYSIFYFLPVTLRLIVVSKQRRCLPTVSDDLSRKGMESVHVGSHAPDFSHPGSEKAAEYRSCLVLCLFHSSLPVTPSANKP